MAVSLEIADNGCSYVSSTSYDTVAEVKAYNNTNIARMCFFSSGRYLAGYDHVTSSGGWGNLFIGEPN